MCTALTVIGGAAVRPLVVLKFGSSLLGEPAGFRVAAAEVLREVERGRRVLAVVSAMRGATDGLLATAEAVAEGPAAGLLSRLLATGEDASVALLTIALTGVGLDAHALTTDAVALHTRGPLRDAEPVDVDLGRLTAVLAAHRAVVMPGFIGRDASGAPSVLGRGGSDLTALFLAARLGADEARLVKDVDGVHPEDPRTAGGGSAPLEEASWAEVARIGNGVVQDKALRFAEAHGLGFRVAAPGGRGTWVGPGR